MVTVSDDVIQVTDEESLVVSLHCQCNFLATGIQFSQRFSINKCSRALVESNLTLSIQGKLRNALPHKCILYTVKVKLIVPGIPFVYSLEKKVLLYL